jgi:hypothetical protein
MWLKIFFMEKIAEQGNSRVYDVDREIASHPKNIPGWGIDADPENDPTYPMKHRNGADYERLNYQRPSQQPVDVEVLHSNERPGITRVFGNTAPPEGLSGSIRRFAFKYSESSYAHWVPLVLADRIDVVRGIIDDLRNGIAPNIFAEKGWKAEWKYNKKGLLIKAAIGIAAITALTMLRKRRRGNA